MGCAERHLSRFGGKFHGSAVSVAAISCFLKALCRVTDHHQGASWWPLSRDNGNNERQNCKSPSPSHDGLEISPRKQGAKSDWDKCHKPFVSEVRQMLQALSLVSVSALCLFRSRSCSFCRFRQIGSISGWKETQNRTPNSLAKIHIISKHIG